MTPPTTFVTGGTGYIGRPLIEALLERGYAVSALARPSAEARLPRGPAAVTGDALDAATFAAAIPAGATIVHLVGTPHPVRRRRRSSSASISLRSAPPRLPRRTPGRGISST